VNKLDPNNPTDLRSIQKVREIKTEILNYGISQPEIIKLIEFLSLELEDTFLMREILNHIQSEKIEKENKIIL
jgi:hypothetical protein